MSKFQIYRGENKGEQCWCWRLLCDDGTNIGRSEEPFLKGSIIPSIKKIKGKIECAFVAQEESTEDQDKGYRFEYFQEKDGKHYWHFKAENHEIMAISGEGFSSENEVCEQINFLRNALWKLL